MSLKRFIVSVSLSIDDLLLLSLSLFDRKDIVDGIIRSCSSLRSGVSKNGFLTVTALTRCLPGGLDDFVGAMVSGYCVYTADVVCPPLYILLDSNTANEGFYERPEVCLRLSNEGFRRAFHWAQCVSQSARESLLCWERPKQEHRT